MQKFAFWLFLGFGIVTVVLALGGGLWALFRSGGAGAKTLGFLLLFFGASLALMLGSLFLIQRKEGKSKKLTG